MSKDFNPQQINNLLVTLAEQGGYTLPELIERLPSLIACYKEIQLTHHPRYGTYTENQALSSTSKAILKTLMQTIQTISDEPDIKTLKPSYLKR
ncbi:MAG: hypothetical protein U1E78_10705 [Gammaproteobacteria bacterium]